ARLMELADGEATLAQMANSLRGLDSGIIDVSDFSLAQMFFTFEAARLSGVGDLDELLDALSALPESRSVARSPGAVSLISGSCPSARVFARASFSDLTSR